MLLGVYWYFGFPAGLYHFDYFTFRPGLGGHADEPAELVVTVHAPNPAALLDRVRAVAARYPETRLFGQAHGALLRLTLGDYHVPDYVFHVAGELEAVLRQEQALLTTEALPPDLPVLSFAHPQDPHAPYRYGGIFAVVGSFARKSPAETKALRLDCHLPLSQKARFLASLDSTCQQAGLDVLYYFDHELAKEVNLMLFFSNGRQGVGGCPLRYTDVVALADTVARQLVAYHGRAGHLGSSFTDYPKRGPHVVRIVDEDFVL